MLEQKHPDHLSRGIRREVAIMLGVPTAPNHMIRARCHEETLNLYPKITIVAKGIDYDEIEIAREQAAAIMQAHPNLKGWVACDAPGPIGIGQAIKEAGKVGKVVYVGSDDLSQMIELIKEGVADSSASTKPRMQGYWSVIALWQATLGVKMPKRIDTGIAIITKTMTKDYKGWGTVFRFEIPVEKVAVEDIEQAEPSRGQVIGLEPGQPSWRILIVEDQLENRLLLKKLLEQVGFEVHEAVNGQEAIDVFEEWRPHFIWMDRRMPLMDGLEAAEQVISRIGASNKALAESLAYLVRNFRFDTLQNLIMETMK